MTTVKIRFPGGRYHATPWGHHVNEGLVEWPPSPWRLLRALLATGFSACQWMEVPPHGRSLIEKLAGVKPNFRLPNSSIGHSRHYMPVIEGRNEKPGLVFDAWANVGEGEVLIHWPCVLSTEEQQLLIELVAKLGYLGRSESWVEAQVVETAIEQSNAFPCENHVNPGAGWEQVVVTAPIPAGEYTVWIESQLALALEPLASQKQNAATKKKQAAIAGNFPSDLIDCLLKDTQWWKGRGWSQPPGTGQVLYWRKSDSLQTSAPVVTKAVELPRVTAMLLAISTPSGNKSALPSVQRTLPQAELIHRALIGRLGRGLAVDCPELVGKDSAGRPLGGPHLHAYTLPLDLDGDERIEHVLIYASGGLGQLAQRTISSLSRTWTKGGAGELQVALVGAADLDCFRQLPSVYGRSIERLIGPSQGATVWESYSPFVPPRFLKNRGRNNLEGQVNSELESRQLPRAKFVEVDPELTKRLRHIICQRGRSRSSAPVNFGLGLRLVLESPVSGPISLGYASHYGLGQFRCLSIEGAVRAATS
jgi:CRISPR-associated protein Csb2